MRHAQLCLHASHLHMINRAFDFPAHQLHIGVVTGYFSFYLLWEGVWSPSWLLGGCPLDRCGAELPQSGPV